MAAPESSGYVPLEGFKYGMKKLGLLVKNWFKRKAGSPLSGRCFGGDGIRGFDLEGAELKKWTDQLLSKTGAGKEVIMRRRHWFRWKVEIGPKNGVVSHGFASKDH